jgi:hypothetical protein
MISTPSYPFAKMIEYTVPENKLQFYAVCLKNQLDKYLDISTPRIRTHKDPPQPPTNLLPNFPVRKCAVLIRALLKVLQHILALLFETLYELLCGGIFSSYSIRDRCSDSVDLLQHLDERVGGVGAGFHLA